MRKKGAFTMVEMVIVLAILGFISAALVILLKTPIDTNVYSEKEFDVQSSLRTSSETINQLVRKSTAAFLLTVDSKTKFSRAWNYLVVENDEDHSSIVLYEWDGKAHVKKVLTEFGVDDVLFSINFEKTLHSKEIPVTSSAVTPTSIQGGNLLRFKIGAKDLTRNKDFEIVTELKPLNSYTIVDNSKMDYSLTPPKKSANCLAFRLDRPNPDMEDEGYHHVAISFVLDTSGSMNRGLNGSGSPPYDQSRIYILKKVLNTFFENIYKQDREGIVDVRVYPTSAKMARGRNEVRFEYTSDLLDNGAPLPYDKYFNVKKRGVNFFNGSGGLVKSINTESGTGIGDGLRFAFHGMKRYDDLRRSGDSGKSKRIKHYLFVLTDGIPSYFTFTRDKSKVPSGHYSETPFMTEKVSKMPCYYVYSDDPVDQIHPWSVYKNGKYEPAQDPYDSSFGIECFSPHNGNGDKAMDYVREVVAYGKKNIIKDLEVDVTVVGFSAQNFENASCNEIGKILGAVPEGGKYYKDCASDEALQVVFKAFTESVINDALWYVSGPQ